MMSIRRFSIAPILLVLLAVTRIAHAGLFDDDEARKRVEALKAQTEERLTRLETAQRSQVDLANQMESMRNDLARLRGQVEVLTHNLEAAQKRQQDYYVDLDTRTRKLEEAQAERARSAAAATADAPGNAGNTANAVNADPAREAREYEAALNLFKANRYKEAAEALEAFVTSYPNATLTPSAQYWMGNSYQAAHDCKRAIEAQQVVIARWTEHAKAPDAFLNIATCQQELGDAKGARKTLESLVAKYPQSGAAQTAKSRLQKK